MTELPENFKKALIIIADRLKDYSYAIRGTASLVLQGLEMNADDIDILGDEKVAEAANEVLKEYLLEPVEYKESDKFISRYGKFKIENVQVEFMCDFQIKDPKGNWTEPYTAVDRKVVNLDGHEIYVTTPQLELEFFAKMGRWNAFHKLRKQLPTREKMLVIDTFNIMHRAFHAIPQTFKDPEGNPTNAIYGVTSMIINLLDQVKPQYFVAAIDGEKPVFRHEDFTGYKAHRRPMEDALSVQKQKVFEVLDAFGIKQLQIDGYEADDIIGALATRFADKVDIIINSNDRDLWQLTGENVFLLVPGKAGDLEWLGRKEVTARLGFVPERIVDYKGLRGDPSDNIPGVFGVGEVTATKLIQEYDTLENIYKNIQQVHPVTLREKLLNCYEQALMSKKLAQIITDVPMHVDLHECKYSDFNRGRVKELLQKYNFKSLIKRLGFDVPNGDSSGRSSKGSKSEVSEDQLSLF